MSTVTYQGLEVLYTRQQIAERVAEMGAQITHDLNGEKLVMIGVLKGAAPFLADLARSIQADATFDFVAVTSYGKGQRSSGAVKLIKDLDEPIEGKNVLIVEDILDTGLTLAFLRKIEATVPRNQDIHLIVDNYSTHKHARVKAWMARRPRWHIHFIPTYSSWLNQVERFFALITEKAIRRGSFSSVKDLVGKVDHFVTQYNKDCTPFVWTATADSIIGKLERLSSRINGTGH